MGKKLTSTPAPKSKPKNLSKKLQDENSQYPEYGDLRNFLGSLTDREKVLVSLCDTLLVADNLGNDAGVYLRNLYDKTINKSRRDTIALIGKSDMGHLATLINAISGLTY